MSSEQSTRKFIVYFTEDTLTPIPVRATDRSEAFRIADQYSGSFGDYRGSSASAAIDKTGGETFDDVDDSDFITLDDV